MGAYRGVWGTLLRAAVYYTAFLRAWEQASHTLQGAEGLEVTGDDGSRTRVTSLECGGRPGG